MSDPVVTAFLTKVLCANGGRLPREQLPKHLDLPQEQIDQILLEESDRFPQAGELVLVRSPIRICPEYKKSQEEEDDCGKLHLCCNYLRGNCWNSKRFKCKYSHYTQSEHNLAVLKANEVNGLNDEELKIILFQNDHSLLLGSCREYLHDKCAEDNCKWLHICGFFMRGECNRYACKKSHDLLETTANLLLKQSGIPAVSIENFQILSDFKHKENRQNQREQVGDRKARGASRGRRGNRGRSQIRKGFRPCTGSRDYSATDVEQRSKILPGMDTSNEKERIMSWKSVEDIKPGITDCLQYFNSNLKEGIENTPSVQLTEPASSGVRAVTSCRTGIPYKVTSGTSRFGNTTSVCPRDSSITKQCVPELSNKSTNMLTTDSSGLQQTMSVSDNKVANVCLSNSQKPTCLQADTSIMEPTATNKQQMPNLNGDTRKVEVTYSSNKPKMTPINDNMLKMKPPTDLFRTDWAYSYLKYNQTGTLPAKTTEWSAINIFGKLDSPRTSASSPTHPIMTIDSASTGYCKSVDPGSRASTGSSRHCPRDSEQSHKSMPGIDNSDEIECVMSWKSRENLKSTDTVSLQPLSSKSNESTEHTPSVKPCDPASPVQAVSSGRGSAPDIVTSVSSVPNTTNCMYTTSSSTAKQIASVSGNKSTKVPIDGSFSAVQTALGLSTQSTNISIAGSSNAQQTMPLSTTTSTNMLSATSSNTWQTKPGQTNVCPVAPFVGLADTKQKSSSSDNTTMNIPTTHLSSKPQPTLVKGDILKTSSSTEISGTQHAAAVRYSASKAEKYRDQEQISTSIQPHVSLSKATSIRRVQYFTKRTAVNTSENEFPYNPNYPLDSSACSASVPSHKITDSGLTNKRESQTVADFTEICLANTWKHCKSESKCPEMHYYLPYRWQILWASKWIDMPDMENIEKAYSDPKMDRYKSVNFLTMQFDLKHVRRLCTPSSVQKPEFVLTTEWLWYWKDENGSWIQYGKANTKQVTSSITCADLENIYLSNPLETIHFSAGQQAYEINFRAMTQRNIMYRTQREVRRRPKFLSDHDVNQLKGRTRSSLSNNANSPLKNGEYPETWDKTAMPEVGHELVNVPLTSSEASSIQNMFTKTLSGYVVKNINRIQNRALWELYQWKKEQIKKTNGDANVNERHLFHGTSSDNLKPICHGNFDWRICGTNGTLYGQGSYFARDASYSHNYSPKDANGQRTMFVARVLVGEYVTGNQTYRRPPSKHGSQTLSYDSCVDNKSQPSIFVVFEKPQIYPEYLIQYEEEKKSCCIS